MMNHYRVSANGDAGFINQTGYTTEAVSVAVCMIDGVSGENTVFFVRLHLRLCNFKAISCYLKKRSET